MLSLERRIAALEQIEAKKTTSITILCEFIRADRKTEELATIIDASGKVWNKMSNESKADFTIRAKFGAWRDENGVAVLVGHGS